MNVLVLGATSAIAEQVARIYAERGAALFLVGRNADRLGVLCDDLRVRGAARAASRACDLDDLARHAEVVDEAERLLGQTDLVVLAQGALGDPARYRESGEAAAQVLHANLVGPASLLTLVATRMEGRRAGAIAAIGSVAGDRGRATNYAYGAAKGGLALFLQGLRNRLAPAGVRVLTVKPGFVDTPMTAGLRRTPLFASPERVARDVVRAVDLGVEVLYTPWWWRLVMLAVRLVPERLFKRMKL